LTPIPAATATDAIDTTKGTVQMVIGGGTSVPSNQLFSIRRRGGSSPRSRCAARGAMGVKTAEATCAA
jgi:hypothetical protein